jgi:menaquinone-dependent protoporphyrinogen oxidase
VTALSSYDAVIVGGTLYARRWHKTARRFVKRRTAELRELPVWLFSSGPLDASAEEHEIPPTPQVRHLMDRIGAQGHETFGGRLAPGASGFPAPAMAIEHAGDWRDEAHVRHWAGGVAAAVRAMPARPHPSGAAEPRTAFHLRWIGACALAEAIGIGFAAAVGSLLHAAFGEPGTGLGRLGLLIAFGAVGAVEGALLSALQWRVLGRRLPLLPRAGWIGVTVAVASAGWMLGMSGAVFAPAPVSAIAPTLTEQLLFAFGIGLGAGAFFGAAQWLVLRLAAKRAGSWVGIHALAWALAMLAIHYAAVLPPQTWPWWAMTLSGVAGGLVAGVLLGAISGFVARDLEPRRLPGPPV